jgi:DNA uptake protein ComE-like DNA-binding protein
MSAKPFYSVFYFTRKEKRGALLLMFLIAGICCIPFIMAYLLGSKTRATNEYDKKIADLQVKERNAKNRTYDPNPKQPYKYNYAPYIKKGVSFKPKGTLFEFDPNTIDEAGWKKLGLRDKTIGTILNFRNKGGKFRKVEDIGKIWGLFPDEADRLKPYVRIGLKNEGESFKQYKSYKTYERPAIVAVDINAADTSALMALPGIGLKLSARILQFRNKLGGFYSLDQVKETYALHDSVFQKIVPYLKLHTGITTININEASIDQLKAHPYIKYHLANAIVQYRMQHGPYRMIEDIKKIMIIDEVIFAKIAPYLRIY